MSATHNSRTLRPQARFLPNGLRDFLSPALYKQAQAARTRGGRRCQQPARWKTQPLLLVLLLMTYSCGDSQEERFQTAQAACILCRHKRRRPGQTIQGFHKALQRLPVAVLRVVAAGIRGRLQQRLSLTTEGFVVLGCDGSLLECPRSAELEQRLGDRGTPHAAPTLWLTALVHLHTGVLWAWRLGRSTASERVHLTQLLSTLPCCALIVADAGFSGYWLAQAILQAKASFLIRASAKDCFYSQRAVVDRERWRDGQVLLWPQTAQKQQQPPLRLRLIRVRARKAKHPVWLLTNILDHQRLPAATASRYYRWRWENEGFFRTYKRTLAKVKLHSRTLRLVHREAEGALLATQLLLAHGARSLPVRRRAEGVARCSARGVLLSIRREMQAALAYRRRGPDGLPRACREQRRRRSNKEKRAWPRRKAHPGSGAPRFLLLSERQKALRQKVQRE